MSLFKQKIQNHYDKQAEKRIFWEKKFNYFFTQIQKYFTFNVLPDSKVLEVGCGTGELLNAVKPSYGVGLDISPKMIEKSYRISFGKYHLIEDVKDLIKSINKYIN